MTFYKKIKNTLSNVINYFMGRAPNFGIRLWLCQYKLIRAACVSVGALFSHSTND